MLISGEFAQREYRMIGGRRGSMGGRDRRGSQPGGSGGAAPFSPTSVPGLAFWVEGPTSMFTDVGATAPAADTNALKAVKDRIGGIVLSNTTSPATRSGNAILFTGAASQFDSAANALDLSAGALTVEVWTKLKYVGGGTQIASEFCAAGSNGSAGNGFVNALTAANTCGMSTTAYQENSATFTPTSGVYFVHAGVFSFPSAGSTTNQIAQQVNGSDATGTYPTNNSASGHLSANAIHIGGRAGTLPMQAGGAFLSFMIFTQAVSAPNRALLNTYLNGLS